VETTGSNNSGPLPRGVPGARFLRAVREQLAPLMDVPAHGNRTLHLHPLIVTLVSSFYDPLIRSLRMIEARPLIEPITGRAVQRMARSTTSDALRTFDPQLLRGIINHLRRQIPALRKADPRLEGIVKKIVAADGSYFSTFGDVAWALHHTKTNGRRQGQIRLNFQMSTEDWVPQILSISGGEECDGSEPDAVTRDLLNGVLYVVDRNFIDFDFLDELLKRDNDFVLRIKGNSPGYEIVQTRPLTDQDIAAGVLADHLVRLPGKGAPAGLFRLVEIRHASKPAETVKLLSSLTDPEVPAHVVGYIYQQRWQIELFFRWLKVWCNFDHLLSTSRQGITTQFYVIVIATLLMHIHLGRKVSKYTLVALRQIALGLATPEQMQAFLARRDRERELDQIRRASKAALKKS
jgi:DDE family transposase